MAIFTTLRGEIHNSIQYKLQNSMEVDGVGIIAVTQYVVYCHTHSKNVDKCGKNPPGVPVENQITTLSVAKIAIKFSPCNIWQLLSSSIRGV